MERGSQFPDDLFHATTQRFKVVRRARKLER